MTQFVYKNLFGSSAYAGPRGNWKPKGVVIHNDAGSSSATASWYMNSYLPGIIANGTAGNGYAHYYCDENLVFQCCDTRYGAWATANTDGNMNYVSYEVCQSMGDLEQFKRNEQACFKQVAKDMAFWELTPNRNTVRLHREFFSTACPHRSYEIHGNNVNAVKDYFISQIKKYMANNDKEVDETPKPPKNPTYWHSSKVKAVKVLHDVEVHETQSLSQSKVIGIIKEGKEVKVLSIWKEGNQKHDKSRLKIEYKGKPAWITGNAYYVESCYYLTGDGKKIKALKDTDAYSASNLTGKKEHVKKGTVLTVVDNVADKAGYARFKLKGGKYVTARRDFWKFV